MGKLLKRCEQGTREVKTMLKNLSAVCRLLSAVVLFSVVPFLAQAATSVCNPYTFVGRVMDAKHDAFGSNRVAKIEAANANGDLLVQTKTFFRADSCRNYALQIPMATSEVDGYVVTNAAIDITVTDDLGKVWRGVVVDASAGVPGGVREVDIVLGADTNGDGIDSDRDGKLDFAGVKDIKLGLKTYSTSGN